MTDLGKLLAVDPSIRSPGAAIFVDGKLVASKRFLLDVDTDMDDVGRCLAAAETVVGWAIRILAGYPDVVALEWPQIYKHDGPAVANAVVPMAGVGGAVAGAIAYRAPVKFYSWLPAEIWGQLPKSKTGKASASPRGQRIVSRLDAQELLVLEDQHDAIDAVGVGLHCLGRLGLRRSLSSG